METPRSRFSKCWINIALLNCFTFSIPLYAQQGTGEFDDLDSTYVQSREEPTLRENFRSITLGDTIEQGLRLNYDQNIRRINEQIIELDWKDAKESFWFPSLTLTLTHAPERVARLYQGSVDGASNKISTGSFRLGLDNYTVFNWGKDYLVYLNQQTTYKRNKENLSERRRELKQDLISHFFRVATFKNVEKIKRDQLRHASYVYRLNREKISVNKVSRQDYYMARAEYLRAQNEFHESKIQSQNADEELAYILKDPVGTRYVLSEGLKIENIKISIDEAMRLSEQTSPSVKDAMASLERAKRLHDLALRENLPLPKFSIDLGAYDYRYGNGLNSTRFRSNAGSSIEMVATINATWSLTGEGGLLNGRKTTKAMLGKHLAHTDLAKEQHEVKSLLRTLYQNILHYQNQMKIYNARIPNLQKTFDTIMENYLKGKADFNDLRDALIEFSQAQSQFELTKWLHLEAKIEMAKNIGLEDFPGENFERLVEKQSTTRQTR